MLNSFKKNNFSWINLILFIILIILIIFYLNEKNFFENKNSKYIYIGKQKNLDYEKIKYDENFLNNEYLNFQSLDNLIKKEEVVNLASSTLNKIDKNILKKEGKYVEIVKSCDTTFQGGCARARSCPSISCPTLLPLRNGMVLKISENIVYKDNISWYEIIFSEWRRYADRLPEKIYISSEYVVEKNSWTEDFLKNKNNSSTTKEIYVKLSEQKFYALEDGKLFLSDYVSTGLEDLPTPIGTFQIFKKTPSRYMQGPIDGFSDQYYDLPGVPWTMYFTNSGAAIHGTYWHDNFGARQSHGCINLRPDIAEKLYKWADLGTKVTVEK